MDVFVCAFLCLNTWQGQMAPPSWGYRPSAASTCQVGPCFARISSAPRVPPTPLDVHTIPSSCTYQPYHLVCETLLSNAGRGACCEAGQMKNLCLRLVYGNDALHPLFPRTLHQVIRKQGLPGQPCVYRRPPIIYKTRRAADAWQGKHVFVSSHSPASLNLLSCLSTIQNSSPVFSSKVYMF